MSVHLFRNGVGLALLLALTVALPARPKPATPRPRPVPKLKSKLDAARAKAKAKAKTSAKKEVPAKTPPVQVAPISPSRPFFLDEALNLGLTRNPRLQASAQAVELAEGDYEQLASQKNPKVVFNDTTQYSTRPFGLIPDRAPDPIISTMTLGMQTLLTTFGKIENEISAAFLRIDVAALQYEVDRQDLTLEIKNAFFERLKADAGLDVAKANLQLAQRSLSDAQSLLEQGIMARYDVVQAELQVVQAQQRVAESSTAIGKSAVALKTVLFDDGTEPITPIAPRALEVAPDWSLERLRAVSDSNRPELAVLNKNIEVANKLLDSANAESRPNLTLATGYATSLGSPVQVQDNLYITLNIQWALWDGGLRDGAVKSARARLATLKAQNESQLATIHQEVEQAWLDFLQTEFTLKTAQQRVEAAQVFYDMGRERYVVGLATSLEIQTALQSLTEARQALVVAVYDREQTYARLERVLGKEFGRKFVPPPQGETVNAGR